MQREAKGSHYRELQIRDSDLLAKHIKKITSQFEGYLERDLCKYHERAAMLQWLVDGYLQQGLDPQMLAKLARQYMRLQLPVPSHYHFPEFYQV